MRILIGTAHRSLVGGVEKYLQAAIRGLLDSGHDVSVLYEYPLQGEPIDPPGIQSWCWAERPKSQLLHSIANWKPDVVYFHGFDGDGSILWEDALLREYPMVLFVHNHDRTCATGRKYYSFPHPQTCTRRLSPMCLLLHYPRRCGGLHPGTMWCRYRRHMQLHSRLNAYQAVLVGSNSMYNELKQHGVQKLRLVPLPTTDISPLPAAPIKKTPTGQLLFIGRLTDVKGVDYLIRAIPKAAQKLALRLNLIIAGDGPESAQLRELGAGLNVPITWFGWADTRQKVTLIRQADLLGIPSLWPEPFGLVGIEAGCLGVPAIGFDVGGIPDWLIPGESGELAPSNPPTVEGLADAMVRALGSPSHYAKLCLGAWNTAQRFTLCDHLDTLETIFAAQLPLPRTVFQH